MKNKNSTEGCGIGKRQATSMSLRPSSKYTAEPRTQERIIHLADMIAKGATRPTIMKYIQDEYHIKEHTAKRYYSAAMRYLLPENEPEFRKELIAKNIARLETIIEKGMKDDSNLKLAKEAIDSLNRMLGLGSGGVQVAVNNDKETDTQQIYIKFE